MTANKSCELCDELNDGRRGLALWPKLVGSGPKRVVMECDRYVAVVTVGPIVRGHCLIVPRDHRSAMTTPDANDRSQLMEFFGRVKSRIETVYSSKTVLFEHGAPDGEGTRPCSVSHAHWHLLPTTIAASDLLMDGYDWTPIDEPFVRVDREFLLVGDGARYWTGVSERPIPSQVLRKRAAERIGGHGEWDWRAQPAVNVVLSTLNDLALAPESNAKMSR